MRYYFTIKGNHVVTHDLSDDTVVTRQWRGLEPVVPRTWRPTNLASHGVPRNDEPLETKPPTCTRAKLHRAGVTDSEIVTLFDLQPAIDSFEELDGRANKPVMCSRWWNPSVFDFPAEKPQKFLARGSSIQILCGIPFEQMSTVTRPLYQIKDHKYLSSVSKFFETVDSRSYRLPNQRDPVWHWCLCSVTTNEEIDKVLKCANDIIHEIKKEGGSLREVQRQKMVAKLSADGGLVYDTCAFDKQGNQIQPPFKPSRPKTREFVALCQKFEKYLLVCCDVVESVKESVKDLYTKNERCKIGQSTWTNTDDYVLGQARRLLGNIKEAATFQRIEATFMVTIIIPKAPAPAQPDDDKVAYQAGIAAAEAKNHNLVQEGVRLISDIASQAYIDAVSDNRPGSRAAQAATRAGIAAYQTHIGQEGAAQAAGRAAGKAAGTVPDKAADAGVAAAMAYIEAARYGDDAAQLAARAAARMHLAGKTVEFSTAASPIVAAAVAGAMTDDDNVRRRAGQAVARVLLDQDNQTTFNLSVDDARIAGRNAAKIYVDALARLNDEEQAVEAATEAVRAFRDADDDGETYCHVSGAAYIAARTKFDSKIAIQASKAVTTAAYSVDPDCAIALAGRAADAAAQVYAKVSTTNQEVAREAAAEAARKAFQRMTGSVTPAAPARPPARADVIPIDNIRTDDIPIEKGDKFDMCNDVSSYSRVQLISQQEFKMMESVQLNLPPGGNYRILDVGLHGKSCELLIDMGKMVAYHGVTFYGERDLRFASFAARKNSGAPKPSRCMASPKLLKFISCFYKEVFPCIYVEGSNPTPSNFASSGPKEALHGQTLPPRGELAKRADFENKMAQLQNSCSLCAMFKGYMEEWQVSWLTPRGVYDFCTSHVLTNKKKIHFVL